MFFILPVGVEYQARRIPVVTFTLMGLCLSAYLASLAGVLQTGIEAREWELQHLWLIPAEGGFLRYFTHMFVHADIFHFLGNMIYLFLFGATVEDMIGRGHFTWFYLAGGLFAAFGYILLLPDRFESFIPMGGASGAISACQGAFVILLPRAAISFRYVYFIVVRFGSGDFQLPAWVVITFWFGMDLLGMVLSWGEVGGGVAFGAHLGGFAFGSGLMLLLRKTTGIVNHPDDPAPVKTIVQRRREQRPAAFEDDIANIYLYLNDSQAGPFSLRQVRNMVSIGSITAESHFFMEGMDDWRPLSDLV